jgi:alkylated DNA repair dioxygenase AlkB
VEQKITMDTRPETRFGLTQPSFRMTDFIKDHTQHPTKMGRQVKRKVIEYNSRGKAYYWKDFYGGEVPDMIQDYLVENDIPFDENSSVLINYYINNSAIGAHCDSTKELAPNSKVYSISLAGSDYLMDKTNKEIGRITFTKHGNFPIMNRSVMSWCPFAHEENHIKHNTSALQKYKMLGGRINITVRQLK